MKNFVFYLSLATFLLLPFGNADAAKLSIGSPCKDNNECQSNDCETSAKEDSQGNSLAFCDCGELDTSAINPSDSQDCVDKYGGVKDDWTCADGADLTWDLDYCKNNNDIHKTEFPIPPKKDTASVIDMLLDSTAVTAQMYKEIDNIVATPQPKISIPGLKFSEPKTIEEAGGDKYLYIPFLGDYISSIYKYLIIVAGIIATAMIIKAGFDWLMSGGEAAKITQAKTRIGQSLMGLFIAVSSYFILYMINPNLVEFKNLRVRFVEKIEIGELLSAEATYNEPDNSDPKTYDKNATINKMMQAAQANNIDPCIAYAIAKKESGGNPFAIGHDENYPHGTLGGKCPAIGARSVFLRSGKTSKGQAFTPIVKYSCADNTNPQKNDDKFVNQPPYYGLDWREGISHGIGLSQYTLKPGKPHTSQCPPADDAKKMSKYPGPCESTACTPNEWCRKVGTTWFTVGELLNPDKNIQSMIALLKKIMKNTADPAAIFEDYNGGKDYVPGAMKYYNKCKSDSALNSTI